MNLFESRHWLIAVAGAGVLSFGCAGSSNSVNRDPGKFNRADLVSNTAAAPVTDVNLVNAWGLAASPTGPWWVANNGTGKATIYDGTGAIQALVVDIPNAFGGANGPVTGQVYNGTADFAIPGVGPSHFIFDSEDGAITAWSTGTTASVVANRSSHHAIYKGLAMASNGGANFLYATDFHNNWVDVFDGSFGYVKHFTDHGLPAGYAPFGISNIGGMLYVTFALQDGAKEDDVPGPGNGYVDVFSPDGTLVKRLIKAGELNSPWAVVQAPSGFGHAGNDLLVGNFGGAGNINAYDISTGKWLGALKNADGSNIAIGGLWALGFGNDASAGSSNTMYFTAGPDSETNGLFGSISPIP